MFPKLLLLAVLCLAFVKASAQAPSPANQIAEKVRTERLVGLAKVWGTVKYFHPFLAYRETDWDKALIETIPRVNAARSPQEYEAAINSMLAALGDKNTRARVVAEASKTRPIRTARDLIDVDFAVGTNFTFVQRLPAPKGDIYKGKVVMLIDENAISQSEHTAMFFEAATDVTFIGTPTAGANGDVTNLVLPGNLTVTFSGHDVRHADGRQLQRIGIQPHIKVAPTIRGVLDGRDEILEAAVKFLQSGKTRP